MEVRNGLLRDETRGVVRVDRWRALEGVIWGLDFLLRTIGNLRRVLAGT